MLNIRAKVSADVQAVAWEGKYWTHPRTLKITKSKYPDFIWTTPYPAVSERFIEFVRENGLTNLAVYALNDMKTRIIIENKPKKR